LTYSR